MTVRAARRGAWLFAAMVPLACAELPPLASGVCGNRVVDPDEDCDTYASEPGAACRAAGVPGECRYACGPQPDGSAPRCPAGMGCGADGACRAPSGTFVAAPQPIPGSFREIITGDVDGDGRGDVVAVEPTRTSVHYFDGSGTPLTAIHTPASTLSPALPVLAELSDDGRADLLTYSSLGTLVELGSEDRTLVPTAFPTVTLPASFSGLRIVTLDALLDKPGQELMAMGTLLGVSALAVFGETTGTGAQGAVFCYLPSAADTLAGSIQVAQLDEDPVASPCDEIALAFVGAADVRVYTSCKPDGAGSFAWNTGALPTNVTLPGGAVIERGPLVLDVNGDGHLDLVVGAATCSDCHEVRVAYGVGDGTFHSDPASIPASGGDGAFAATATWSEPLPLAMGDLNGDGVPDRVTPSAVLVSSDGAGGALEWITQAKNTGAPWTEAVVADLNHDGVPDVLAGSSAAPNIAFWNGVGDAAGSLNGFLIPTHGPVAHLAVADFDGDLVADVALSEIAAGGSGTASTLGDSVSILFGRPVGAPEPPISMGRLDSLTQILAGRGAYDDVVDGIADVISVSIDGDGNTELGGFQGRSDRVLRSPWAMARTEGVVFSGYLPWRYAVGHFAGDDAHLDIAAIGVVHPQQSEFRLWLIPTRGEARFVTTEAREGDTLPAEIDWSKAVIAAVDLDGDGVDELVTLGPSTADPTRGMGAVARVVPTPTVDPEPAHLFALGAPTPLEALFARSEADPAEAGSGRLRVVDVDGDGRPDVVAIAVVSGANGGAPEPHVVVLWNEGDGALGPMTVVPSPGGDAVVDFAIARTGHEGRDSGLALATGAGVYLASFDGRTPNVAARAAIEGVAARLIAAGDVDGDGVDDLAVADAAQITIYRGAAVRP